MLRYIFRGDFHTLHNRFEGFKNGFENLFVREPVGGILKFLFEAISESCNLHIALLILRTEF